MEEIPAAATAAAAAAPTSRAGRLWNPGRFGGVSRVWWGTREPGPVRLVWVRFLLPLFVGTRARARRMPRDRAGLRGGWRRATLRRRRRSFVIESGIA